MSEGAPLSDELIDALLPHELDFVSIARRLVEERLHGLIGERLLDDLKAVVGELVWDEPGRLRGHSFNHCDGRLLAGASRGGLGERRSRLGHVVVGGAVF